MDRDLAAVKVLLEGLFSQRGHSIFVYTQFTDIVANIMLKYLPKEYLYTHLSVIEAYRDYITGVPPRHAHKLKQLNALIESEFSEHKIRKIEELWNSMPFANDRHVISLLLNVYRRHDTRSRILPEALDNILHRRLPQLVSLSNEPAVKGKLISVAEFLIEATRKETLLDTLLQRLGDPEQFFASVESMRLAYEDCERDRQAARERPVSLLPSILPEQRLAIMPKEDNLRRELAAARDEFEKLEAKLAGLYDSRLLRLNGIHDLEIKGYKETIAKLEEVSKEDKITPLVYKLVNLKPGLTASFKDVENCLNFLYVWFTSPLRFKEKHELFMGEMDTKRSNIMSAIKAEFDTLNGVYRNFEERIQLSDVCGAEDRRIFETYQAMQAAYVDLLGVHTAIVREGKLSEEYREFVGQQLAWSDAIEDTKAKIDALGDIENADQVINVARHLIELLYWLKMEYLETKTDKRRKYRIVRRQVPKKSKK